MPDVAVDVAKRVAVVVAGVALIVAGALYSVAVGVARELCLTYLSLRLG